MTALNASSAATPPARRGGSVSRLLAQTLASRGGKIGLTLTLFVAVFAFVGPFVPIGSATDFTSSVFALPGGDAGPLGGDALGRDVLARVLNGGGLLLILATASTALAVSLGAVAGVVAAYRGGRIEAAIMRSTDVMLAIPQLVFVLLLVSVAGANIWLLILAVALCQAPQVARVAFASAQDICERDFVKAVALWGVSSRVVIGRHVMPGLITPLTVEAALRLSFSIILISGLNFLGFGTQPPDPSWGVMVNENRLGLATNYWGVIAPAILLGILAVGTNVFADALARSAYEMGHEEESEADTIAVPAAGKADS